MTAHTIFLITILTNVYTLFVMLFIGLILFVLPYLLKNFFNITLFNALLAATVVVILFYPTVLNNYLTNTSNMEIYVSRITSKVDLDMSMSKLFLDDDYQVYLLSNDITQDIFLVHRTNKYGIKLILDSAPINYNCTYCTYFLISARNRGKKIMTGFEIIGELSTKDFEFLDCDPKLNNKPQKGTFGRGRFILTVGNLIQNELVFCGIRVNKDVGDLNLSCIYGNNVVRCRITRYDVTYFNYNYSNYPNKESKELKQYILNKKTLTFDEVSAQIYSEMIRGKN